MYKFDYDYFSGVLGMSESSNNYKAQNGIAYGKYQFIPSTFNQILADLGLEPVTPEQFLNNPSLQETAFRGYVNEILNYIIDTETLTRYLGKPITGKTNGITTTINLYGMVAGAWLSGRQGLYNYLVYDDDKADMNGTYISDYIAKFSDDFNKKKDSLNMESLQ